MPTTLEFATAAGHKTPDKQSKVGFVCLSDWKLT